MSKKQSRKAYKPSLDEPPPLPTLKRYKGPIPPKESDEAATPSAVLKLQGSSSRWYADRPKQPSENELWDRLAANLPRISMRDIRRAMSKLERKRDRILKMFPELDDVNHARSESEEEIELRSIDNTLRRLKLEIARRGRRVFVTSSLSEDTQDTAGARKESLISRKIMGERSQSVAMRRTSIRNKVRGAKRRPTNRDLCKTLDFDQVPLPEGWRERGIKTWAEAYTNVRSIHTMFSKDLSAIESKRR